MKRFANICCLLLAFICGLAAFCCAVQSVKPDVEIGMVAFWIVLTLVTSTWSFICVKGVDR